MRHLVGQKKTPITFSRYIHNPFLSLQREIDSAISEFYNMFESPWSKDKDDLMITPSVDIVEDDKNFKVEVEIPGMGEEDVKVFVSDRILCIQGKKEVSKKDEKKNYISREISYGSYERSIPLPEYVDADKAEATFKKGMLWVNFPKKENAKKQYREIKIEKAEK